MKRIGAIRFVVTAGPTREYLDPVRFLSNPSTGKMGFAIARAAVRRGHRVTLIAGPVALKTPTGVNRIDIESARDMLSAVERALAGARKRERVILVSAAAIADWRPAKCSSTKLKKRAMSGMLKLVRNPDVLKTINRERGRFAADLTLVGFAAETGDARAEAARKCREKGLAFVVANDVTRKGAGFASDTNIVSFVYPDGACLPLPLMSKQSVAARIVRTAEALS